jgi:hypothetical protein
MKKIMFIIFVVAIAACGCATKQSLSTASSIDVTSAGVYHLPVVADLDIGAEKVTGVATASTKSESVEVTKSYAIIDAIDKAKADVLVAPQYVVTKKEKLIHVTVTGFPATYVNFRALSLEEIPLIRSGDSVVVDEAEKATLLKRQ